MPTTLTHATLPQLLDRWRASTTSGQADKLNDLSRLTYHSIAIEDSPLTLPHTRNLLQTAQPIPDNISTD